MQRAVAVLALALAVVPSAAAYHLSVGSQDAVGVQPQESPSSPDVGEELYQRGLDPDCPEDLDPRRATSGELGDGFCGELRYQPETSLAQISPPDQDLGSPVGTFDVVLTQYAGTYGLDTCYPWCAPGGTTVYGAASQALTDAFPELFPADADDENAGGHQSYAVDLRTPHPAQLSPVGAEGSGWMLPTTDPTFVGFLEDEDGEPIDADRLSEVVTRLKQDPDGLPSSALPVVCGFSPDFGPPGPTREAPLTATPTSVCDVGFKWRGEGRDTDFGPSGNDRCASAAYVCGTNQPAWYGQLTCKGWTGCQAPHEAGDPWHSTGDYDTWHFVVAPTPSRCGTQQEPGFQTNLEGAEGGIPYLAHDLDVYTPVTSSTTQAASASPVQEFSDERVGPVTGSVDTSSRIDPARSVHTASTAAGIPLADNPGYRSVVKAEIPEPNAPGDTSKSIELERAPGPCDFVGYGSETERTMDPWVNQIDTIQRFQTWNGMDGTQAEPYLNTDDSQDQNNRAGPGFYLSDGKVGMFADVDDDGTYDQAGEQNLFDIQRLGAYPMFWDMHLDENLEPSGGCQPSFANPPIAEAMAAAGYGPRTGLVEAIYIQEPTAVYDRRTNEVFPYPDGNKVFLAQSQAIKALREAGNARIEQVVQNAIDATGAPETAEIVPFAELMNKPSDFWGQCDEETGRYVQRMMVYHDCSVDCSGDTIVTKYVFEVERTDGVIGGGPIPAFQPDGQTPYSFGEGVHVWTDVDPFDNDPDRNTRDGTPPH